MLLSMKQHRQKTTGATTSRWLSSLLLVGMFWASVSFANSELPIATTVTLPDGSATPGMVVRFDESTNRYALSQTPYDGAVYGVVGERPAIVYVTASNTVPVVTQGVSAVLVDVTAHGPIARGDVLTTSDRVGSAMRADLETDNVFAIALEDLSSGQGLVFAEVGVARAREVQAQRRATEAALAAALLEGTGDTVGTSRLIVAAVVALSALGFLLWSFRSILNSGVLSVGRNPRARSSVVFMSLSSMTMVLLLVGVVVFIALAILVLPI